MSGKRPQFCLCYNSDPTLFPSQDVLLICCTPDWINQNHVLASCRMVLRSQNILGLSRAPCLAVFLERLPLLLQEQYSYERVITEYAFQTCFSIVLWASAETWLHLYCLKIPEPRGSGWPAHPQCLPAEPGLLDCWSVFRETSVPLPMPPTPHQLWFSPLPVRVELARHLRHYCPQCWGHRQRYCLPRILHCFRLWGGGCHWNRQGVGECAIVYIGYV